MQETVLLQETVLTRRRVLQALMAGFLVPACIRVTHAGTPVMTEGPFYPPHSVRFDDVDNDLVRISGAVQEAGGEIFRLYGQIRNKAGVSVPNARIEIWQTDMNGRYLHSADHGEKPRDAAFQGFGHDITDDDGFYEFRTIKPAAYPGRTPHIHMKVITGIRVLVTQFFIAGEPLNERDSIYRQMSTAERQSVEMRFTGSADDVSARVDLVI